MVEQVSVVSDEENVYVSVEENVEVAPPHPDVDGADPQTPLGEDVDTPEDPSPTPDSEKQSGNKEARPASDAAEATKEEL